MTTYTVHSYLVVRATMRGIEASSKEEAIRKADETNVDILKDHLKASDDCDFAEECVGYTVDVDVDTEYSQYTCHKPDGSLDMPKPEVVYMEGKTPLRRGDTLRPEVQQDCLATYVNRFTGESRPNWAARFKPDGTLYKPHFKDDKEWLSNTWFPVNKDGSLSKRNAACHSQPTWPEGA